MKIDEYFSSNKVRKIDKIPSKGMRNTKTGCVDAIFWIRPKSIFGLWTINDHVFRW